MTAAETIDLSRYGLPAGSARRTEDEFTPVLSWIRDIEGHTIGLYFQEPEGSRQVFPSGAPEQTWIVIQAAAKHLPSASIRRASTPEAAMQILAASVRVVPDHVRRWIDEVEDISLLNAHAAVSMKVDEWGDPFDLPGANRYLALLTTPELPLVLAVLASRLEERAFVACPGCGAYAGTHFRDTACPR